MTIDTTPEATPTSDATLEHNGGVRLEGTDERLEVLSEAPLVLATPISLLAGQRITEKDRLTRVRVAA